MIEFKNVSKTYPNGTKGLKNINLKIEQGEFLAIIGLSGAGKSTLIRTINRMIDITEGELIVDGVNVMSLRGPELRRYRRKVGMIFQSFNLVNRSSVLKNVLASDVPDMPWYKTLLGMYSKEQKIKALEALDKVNILEKAYNRCDELSGGQQQRVALARTLNQNPSIILADEPVASLDPIIADVVMSDFARINKELNISILLNIHHVDLALKYATRVLGIRAGEIVYDGPTSEVTQEILDMVYNGKAIPTTADANAELTEMLADMESVPLSIAAEEIKEAVTHNG
ncbi:MAG: phosphonate ABC transporter ATP-binding protein [Firmicutes bacterium]|nr:phosphonate ABC transporter ATP-binding protein [Bacillota bacterium]